MRIVLADNQRQRGDKLRRVMLSEGLTCDAEDAVGYEGLPGRLAGAKPDLVLVTCNGATDEALAAIRTAHQITDVPVLAAGENATIEAVREAMRAGAREFLDLTHFRLELCRAILDLGIDNDTGRRGEVISLFSPSGGIGASTASINLAAHLAGDTDAHVALIDLKPAPSDLSLLLDIEPRHTLDDVCRQWERLDRQMLCAAMTRHRCGLQVLAQTGYPEAGGVPENTLSARVVRRLLTLIPRVCDTAVVDLAHTLDPTQIEAMRLSSFVGLIVRPDVPGLKRARWALETAVDAGVPRERFRLVLGRAGQRGQVDVGKIERALGIEVFQQIPEDYQAVNRAINEGLPLVETSKRSRITRSFSSFAQNVQTCTGSASA
ncbi:MAG: hypothetical protein HQ567_32035 [Candidatus Nealsonbacteria bacterium]|nr:hypothetical protein [Candidatus Nealsonbacteria bacterium]